MYLAGLGVGNIGIVDHDKVDLSNLHRQILFEINDLKKEKVGDKHPLKRHGNANDIANSVVHLLSDNSSWITGQTFGVDGGMSSINLS